MLTIDPDKVCHVVANVRVFDADIPEPGDDPGSDMAGDEVEALDLADDEGGRTVDDEHEPYVEELKNLIRDMNIDEQIELVALAWLGRGSFSVDEWADAKAEARRAHNERTAEYLLGMPMLGDYLEEGLAAFGKSCDE
ncbi:MAG: DUF3775 domain-containing protein [Geminicoccaceae bacterium]|nr:DUF3775 domain-containing protein [Geminicoccaceae bacterium]